MRNFYNTFWSHSLGVAICYYKTLRSQTTRPTNKQGERNIAKNERQSLRLCLTLPRRLYVSLAFPKPSSSSTLFILLSFFFSLIYASSFAFFISLGLSGRFHALTQNLCAFSRKREQRSCSSVNFHGHSLSKQVLLSLLQR